MSVYYKEEEIENLIRTVQSGESANIDAKQGFNWNENKELQLKITKAILAMANTKDGGTIIIGVKNDGEITGVDENDLLSFDQTSFNDTIHTYSAPPITAKVHKAVYEEKNIIIVKVPEFNEEPILCKKDAANSDGKNILRRGALYIRTAKAESVEVPTENEMRELLGRAMTKKSDELLNSIQRMLTGKPKITSIPIQDKYKKDISQAEEFFSNYIGDELKKFGYWEMSVKPTEYKEDRILDSAKLREIIQKSEVRLSGWNFPHTEQSPGQYHNFSSGIEAYTNWWHHIEAFRFYRNGLFIFRKIFWEDVADRTKEGKSLAFIMAINMITEFMLFVKRVFDEQLNYKEDLEISIKLNKTDQRKLLAPTTYYLFRNYISYEPQIVLQRKISSIELQSSWKEIANGMVIELFRIFNWNDITFEEVERFQDKLLKKDFSL